MRNTLLTLALLATTACGGWTKKDTLLELGFAAVTAEDWKQTRTITYYCNETNPIIGQCGENVSADVFMPTAIVLHALVSAALPKGWVRTAWQATGIGAEVSTTWSNYRGKWWEEPTVVEGGHIVPYKYGER